MLCVLPQDYFTELTKLNAGLKQQRKEPAEDGDDHVQCASEIGGLNLDKDALEDGSSTAWRVRARHLIHEQRKSSFFARLPLEIRRSIYEHLWEAAGATQHIYLAGDPQLARLGHAPCVIDPDARDEREEKLMEHLHDLARVTRDASQIPSDTPSVNEQDGSEGRHGGLLLEDILGNPWSGRMASDWCHHWACEEQPRAMPLIERREGQALAESRNDGVAGNKARELVQESSPFLSVLLACKRMHDEAIDDMYRTLKFSFVDSPAMARFLRTTHPFSVSQLASVHLIWRAPISTYANDGGVVPDWRSLWQQLRGSASRLNELRVWVYPKYPRYPMPKSSWFEFINEFESMPKNGGKLSIHLAWHWDHEELDDLADGEIPAFLEGYPGEITRVPPLQYEAETWRLLTEYQMRIIGRAAARRTRIHWKHFRGPQRA